MTTRTLALALCCLLAAACGSTGVAIGDAGPGADAAVVDGGLADGAVVLDGSAGTDAAVADAGPACEGGTEGWCAGGDTCFCCPAGGPSQRCVCSEPCMVNSDCGLSRPICEFPPGEATGFCLPADFSCCWLCQ